MGLYWQQWSPKSIKTLNFRHNQDINQILMFAWVIYTFKDAAVIASCFCWYCSPSHQKILNLTIYASAFVRQNCENKSIKHKYEVKDTIFSMFTFTASQVLVIKVHLMQGHFSILWTLQGRKLKELIFNILSSIPPLKLVYYWLIN